MEWGKVVGNNQLVEDRQSCAIEWDAATMFEDCPPQRQDQLDLAVRGRFPEG